MQRVALPDDRIAIEGAVDVDRTETGVVPRRLSESIRHQLPPEVDFLAGSPSGVRLAFRTNSSSVGIDVMPTLLQMGELPVRPSLFDLVVDGERVATEATESGHRVVVDPADLSFEFVAGEPATVTFPGLPGSESRHVEIWLPTAAIVEVRGLVIDDDATLEASMADGRLRWVHHGSSISHCMEASSPSRSWPAAAAALGGVHLTNLGLAGQCHLDQWATRTIRDLPADLLSLKVGINIVNGDTLRLRTFGSALHGFLDTVREGHPEVPFLVVSPIICPVAEHRPGPTLQLPDGTYEAVGTPESAQQGALTLSQVRDIVAQVVAVRRAAGDAALHYLDGRELFGTDDLADLPDGLHPNGAGYERMGERFNELAFAGDRPLAPR